MEKNDNSYQDSDDDSQPSGAECLELCKKFAEVTETDRALAMYYLQENKWDLDRALNKYLQQTQTDSSKRTKVVACFNVDQLNQDERRHEREDEASNFESESERMSPDQIVANDVDDNKSNEHFKIMSWNIDGLDKGNIESRAIGVTKKILNEKPDVVLLQEVIDKNEKIIRDELADKYEFISGDKFSSETVCPLNHYYIGMLIKRKTCVVKSKNLIDLPNSVMGRNLLEVRLNYSNKVNLSILTTHLESTADFAKQRVEQLRFCFEYISGISDNLPVFFGGDLNLRDSELSSIGGVPKGMYDVWESTGSRKECLYTWDCSRNTNLTFNTRFKPKNRFDRLYFRPSKVDPIDRSRQVTDKNNSFFTLTPVYFELEGLEKLKSCGRFCSDHWAIQAYCQLEANKSI